MKYKYELKDELSMSVVTHCDTSTCAWSIIRVLHFSYSFARMLHFVFFSLGIKNCNTHHE